MRDILFRLYFIFTKYFKAETVFWVFYFYFKEEKKLNSLCLEELREYEINPERNIIQENLS